MRKTQHSSGGSRQEAADQPEMSAEFEDKDVVGPGANRTVVLIAGMHRSGTSALARVLNSRGMTLAEDLMGPNHDNERGFFESIGLAGVHDKFFSAVGHGYDNARSLPEEAFVSPPARHLRERIVAHIQSFDSDGIALIKDPRISRLLPIWKEAAASINVTLKVVIAVRNPLEVAASLDRRNRFSYEKSLLLWLRYMVSAEVNSRGLSRVVVGYPNLLKDWRAETDRIGRQLELELPDISELVNAQASEFLSPALRHHHFDEYSVYEDPRVSNWVRDVYGAFLKASRNDDSELIEVVDRVSRQLSESGDILESMITRSDGQIFMIAEKVAGLEQALDDARANLGAQDERASSKEGELSDLRRELASKEADLDAIRGQMRLLERNAVGMDDESGVAPGPLARYINELRSKVQDALTALEQARADSERYRREAGELEGQLLEAHNSAAALAKRLQETEENHRLQVDRDRQAIGIAEGEVARLNIDAERLQVRLDELEAAGQHPDRKVSELIDENTALLDAKTADRTIIESQARELDLLRTELHNVQMEATGARADAQLASQQAEHVREKFESAREMSAALPALSEHVERLRSELATAVSQSAVLLSDKQDILARQLDLTQKISALEAKEARAQAAQKELVRLRLERARSKKYEYAQDRKLAAREADLATIRTEFEAACERIEELNNVRASSHDEARVLRETEAALRARSKELTQEVDGLRVQNVRFQSEEVAARAARDEAELSIARLSDDLKNRLGIRAEQSAAEPNALASLAETLDTLDRRARWLEDRFRRGIRPKSGLSVSIARSGLVGGFLSVVSGLHSPSLALRPVRALRLAHQAALIRKSGAFDEAYYLEKNWDVRLSNEDPVMHYLTNGAAEGRDPSAGFSTAAYLRSHRDVAAAKVNPLVHHLRHGVREGRRPVPPPQIGRLGGAESDQFDVDTTIDPYERRPDDSVVPEARRGADFLERYCLLTEGPQFAAAVAELNSMARGLQVEADGAPGEIQASIIIPVYGQLAYTLNCLNSLLLQTSNLRVEVIVVDDCSVDETPEWLPRVNWLRYVRQTTNGGFISSCNLGADQARGALLVFLNNDTRVVPAWLDELAMTFTAQPNAGLVGSKLFYPDGSLQEAGGIFWRDGSAWNYGRNDDSNKPEYCYARRVDYVSGASIAVKREVWDEVGGFDGEYYDRAYCEDADLAFQIRKAGYETWFQPLSRVIHYEGKTSGVDVAGGEKAYQVSNQKKFFDRWRGVLESHAENGDDPYVEANREVQKIALVVDATSPMPWRDAGSVTVINTIRALQRLNFRVVFVPQDNLLYVRSSAELLQRAGVEVLHLPYTASIKEYLTLHSQAVGLVHIFRYLVAIAELKNIRSAVPEVHVTLNVMDLHHVRVQREAELSGDSKLMKLATEQIKRDELEVIGDVDTAFVHTVPERDIVLAERPTANVHLYPYVTDEIGRDAPFSPRAGIMFLGGYDHSPNVDAAEFFVSEVMPILRRRLPGVRIHLAGSSVNARVYDLEASDVIIDGFVPKLQSYYSNFRVFVAPLRYGAGIKGKVAAAMVHGVPSVISSVAAEGMDLQDGIQCFIRDDVADIAEAIVRVYDDEKLWEAMSDAAVKFGLQAYSLDAACRAFERALGKPGRLC